MKNTNEPVKTAQTGPAYRASDSTAEDQDKFLELASTLNRSLELSKVVELFSDEISPIVPHDGLAYTNKNEQELLFLGEKKPHHCNYHLLLGKDDLGELDFYRKTPFTNNEVEQIETLISMLLYPLRNSLLYQQALKKALRDPLTGVSNRAAMDTALEQETHLAKRHDSPLSIIIVDIDEFKKVNDTFGHIVGDIILKKVADCMTETVRLCDVVYRYGGEEFVILLRNTPFDGAQLLAERIRAAVTAINYKQDDVAIHVTVSAGLTTMEKDDTSLSLLERCDKALYQAKESGRNRVIAAE